MELYDFILSLISEQQIAQYIHAFVIVALKALRLNGISKDGSADLIISISSRLKLYHIDLNFKTKQGYKFRFEVSKSNVLIQIPKDLIYKSLSYAFILFRVIFFCN
ncbi:hypothetical protein C4G84_RS23255 [Vibrio parahaemolyticus O5:K30]|uniref:hypothetical protein n=1 Tax=Vibrio vulnificus TaxID=672 RepID=UPI003D9CA21E|nr:hypothetical protein [Vibrio parahaemolyticus O5:K30]